MNATLAALATGFAILGGFIAWIGCHSAPAPAPRRRPDRLLRWWRGWSRARRIRLLAGVVLGLLATLFTGSVPALALVPGALVVLPELLGPLPQPELRLLEALDRWVRLLTASVGTGKSVPDAIRATRSQVPASLAEPIRLLVLRLGDRWPLPDALQAMADELDQADADVVLAALILIGERGGVGASATLDALSAALQDRLRAWREIGAERAKPLVVVRQVTVITLVVLVVSILVAPDYFAPYGSPVGQFLSTVLAGGYLTAMYALRRMAAPRHRERILIRNTGSLGAAHG